MAPTEESILRSFLLQKAGLRDVLTAAEFSTYFPLSKRSSPLVRHLYRDIQSQRNAICDFILKQINVECRFGENQVARKRAEREHAKTAGSVDTEEEADINLFGVADTGTAVGIEVMLLEMKKAVDHLRESMDQIQLQIDDSLGHLERISGDMSDLKYGTTDQHVIKELKVYQPVAPTDNVEALVQTSDRFLNQ